MAAQTPTTHPEFTILDEGVRFRGDAFDYALFQLQERGGNICYRAVMLKELAYVPIEARENPDVLGKQWMAVRGLYNAHVDFSYLAFGAFQPLALGVSQFYGAQAEAHTEAGAIRQAARSMAAVEAVLANFPHSRLQDPPRERILLLVERMRSLPQILAILGHPDPRRAEKGMGRDGSLGEMDDELASQQGELLLRGLAKLRSDFVFAVTAAHIARGELAKALVKMSQVASQMASRQRGALSASFSMAIPLTTALSQSLSSQHGQSHTQAHSQGEGVSEGWSSGAARSWGHSVAHGETHGEASTDSVAVSDGVAHSQGVSLTHGQADTSSWGHSNGGGVTHGQADTGSWSHTDSQAHSSSHAQSVGHSQGSNWSQAHSSGVAHGVSQTDGRSHSVSDGSAQSWSQGNTQGSSHATTGTTGSSWSQGQSNGVSGGESSGWSAGSSQSQSGNVSQGASWSAGQSQSVSGRYGVAQADSVSSSQSAASSVGQNTSHSDSASNTLGASLDAGASASGHLSTGALPGGNLGAGVNSSAGVSGSHSWGGSDTTGTSATQSTGTAISQGMSSSQSASIGASASSSQGVGGSAGSSSGWSAGQSEGVSGNQSAGWSQGVSQAQGGYSGTAHTNSSFASQTSSVGGSTSHGVSNGSFSSTGQSTVHSSADTASQGGFTSRSQGESWGTAATRGQADSVGGAHTASLAHSRNWSDSVGGAHSNSRALSLSDVVTRSRSVSHGQAHTVSQAESVSEGWSEGQALSQAHQVGRSHSTGAATAQAIAVAGGRGFVGGFGGGIIPGFSIGRSWQTEDHVAMRLTELVNGLQSLLNHATAEGGFMTSAMLLVDERGAAAARALIPQAFHGPQMPTPIMTVEAGELLRPHVRALRPSFDFTASDPFGVGLWTRWGTLHTPEMVAALTAPNLFEEGLATTVQERMPGGLAFYPQMVTEQDEVALLGHQISPETGDLTATPLWLTQERHFHTAFIGDTGYGKSVAAVRLVLESTRKWRMRTLVLDFGAGWRQLLNVPALHGHVEIRQLSPGGVRPLRWNPLQIGRHILPEVQWRAFCDIFGAIARLGVRRQVAELREALRRVYLQAGVLIDDPELPGEWAMVRAGEEALLGKVAGTLLAGLSSEQKQLIAVERSQAVGLAELYAELESKLSLIPRRDTMLRGVLEGILFRLHPLVQGAAARQYAAGEDAIDINEVVPGEPALSQAEGWGVAVLEGGAFLDEFSKAFLLGWTAWHIYTDAVVQRLQRAKAAPAQIQIVFEEANKILSGVDAGDDEGGAVSTAEQFAAMWRDSRKYGIWLHLITQSPSLIPPGILSSCNNVFAGQVKNRRDQDVVIGMLHKSPVGFTDEVWRRFLASLPVARAVVKLGYAFDRAQVEPVYVQPLLVRAQEPSDEEIVARLGGVG